MASAEMTQKMKSAIGKVANKDVENYLNGFNLAAWALVDDRDNGRVLLVKWPGNSELNLMWSPISAGIGDLGTVIGSVSTEYFGIDAMLFLLCCLIDSYDME